MAEVATALESRHMNLLEQDPQPDSDYRTIPLTQGYVAMVDAQDYERVISVGRWYVSKEKGGLVYARRMVPSTRKRQALHRFILGLSDPTVLVDHRDHNGLNNRRSNLRIASRSTNSQNMRKMTSKPCTSRFKGTSWHRGTHSWHSYIKINGKRLHLGHFQSELEAASAYNTAAREIFGEFAYLNQIPAERIEKEK